jgi:hypothetical protein
MSFFTWENPHYWHYSHFPDIVNIHPVLSVWIWAFHVLFCFFEYPSLYETRSVNNVHRSFSWNFCEIPYVWLQVWLLRNRHLEFPIFYTKLIVDCAVLSRVPNFRKAISCDAYDQILKVRPFLKLRKLNFLISQKLIRK